MDIVVLAVVVLECGVCVYRGLFRGFSIFIDAISMDSWMNRRIAMIH